jgi:CBS domain-containing protein
MQRLTVADVMTRDVFTVGPEAGYQTIADLLVTRSVSAVPVVDESGRVLGIVSEADLLAKLEYTDRLPHHALATRRMRGSHRKARGDIASELMSSPAVTIGAEASVSRAARLMDAARVKRLPVVDPHGRLLGLVSRRDLVRLYARSDAQIRSAVHEVLRALWLAPDSIAVSCEAGVVGLQGRLDRRTTAEIVVNFVRSTPGVVDVQDELTWVDDDSDLHEGWYRSHQFSADPYPARGSRR